MANFTWISFYKELSNKLLEYEDKDFMLITILDTFRKSGIRTMPISDINSDNSKGILEHIDPFTFYSNFNRGITEENRKTILLKLKDLLNLNTPIPEDFNGIPILFNMKSWFFSYKKDRKDNDIHLLWKLFKEAILSGISRETFNEVMKIRGVNINITIGLFWVRPDLYIGLDSVMQAYTGIDFKKIDYDHYMEYINKIRARYPGKSFAEISYDAWLSKRKDNKSNYWIFHSSPKIWDSRKEIKKYDNGLFGINIKYEKDIKPGDEFALWSSGENAGVVAFGYVASNPESLTMDDDRIDEFAINPEDFAGEYLRVELDYTERFPDNPIPRDKILQNDFLKNEKVFNNPQGLMSAPIKKEKYIELKKMKGEEIFSPMTSKGINMNKNVNLNIILYGPPGTGKTYNVVNEAIKIIEENVSEEILKNRDELLLRFNKYKERGQIQFITFHQSYSYEEFIEGLKPIKDDSNNIGYDVEDGIFKTMCIKARVKSSGKLSRYDFDENNINFYKMSLGNVYTDGDEIFNYCIENNVIALGYGYDIDFSSTTNKDQILKLYKEKHPEEDSKFGADAVERFKHWMKIDDIVIISHGNHKIKAIGRIKGEYCYNDKTAINYNHFRNVEWLYKDSIIPVDQVLNEKILSQQTIYQFYKKDLKINYIKSLLSSDIDEKEPDKHILIIDEINRGNISKIFGELITLIEEDKRLGAENELSVTLPYSKETFGIPSNVYIIGTMNTADRSIALMDTALRRRFTFIELMPDFGTIANKEIEGIRIDSMLEIMNKRIEYLYDRDHQIGHAYFININTFQEFQEVFKNRILPLLQEYFYDDWEKIRLVLNDHKKNKENQFIQKTGGDGDGKYRKELFGGYESLEEYDDKAVYSINGSSFDKLSSYIDIYKQ